MSQIYAISDDILTPDDKIISSLKQLLSCGIKIFQYRCKQDKDEALARQLLRICDENGAVFVVNDDVDFALKIGAKSVHIGKDDSSLEYARRVLGDDAFIGVSCYNSLETAKKAQENGASYVAFGSVFPSATKPNATTCGLEILKKAKQTLDIPVCAIGGINISNINFVAQTGVDYIAVISALYHLGDIKGNVLNLNKALNLNE